MIQSTENVRSSLKSSKNAKKTIKFDPTIKIKSSDTETAIVWETESIEKAIDNIKYGIKTKNPFFENNPLRRGNDIVFKPSAKEMDEYFDSMMDLHHYSETHCMLKRGDGEVGHIKLRDYQDIQLRKFLDEPDGRHIMLWSRQASKTTSSCLFILWNMTFKNNRITAILGNKLSTSVEVLNKIKEIYELLPFHLKAGVVSWNEKVLSFDNKCVILARACTKDALNGLSVYILYIDEFAFCFNGDVEQQKEFLGNAQPTLSSFADSVLIITSTPNGKDYFFELYEKAMKGLSTFKATRVYWWQIPNRDEKWANAMRSEIGDDVFKVQYELSFDVTMQKLLSVAVMQLLDKIKTPFIKSSDYFEHSFFSNYVNEDGSESVRVSPQLVNDEIDIKKQYYITTSDLAEGLGGDADFTTQHAFRVCHKMIGGKPRIYFKQDIVFESNVHSLDKFSKFACEFHTQVLEQDRTRYLFEANKYGEFHRLQILNIGDDEFDMELYPETFFKFRRSADSTRMSIGILTNRAIKKLAVKGFVKAMEKGLYEITDDKTIEQISNFQKDKKGNYQAEIGHDDLVAPIINMSWLIALNPNALRELIEEYLLENKLDNDKIYYLVDLDNDSKYLANMRDENDDE